MKDILTEAAEARAGTKRKANTAGGEKDVDADFVAKHATGTNLAEFRVEDLKDYCRLHSLLLKGTKLALVERVTAHLDERVAVS